RSFFLSMTPCHPISTLFPYTTLFRSDYWKISIADNGIGFEPHYSKKIFELFQRLHSRKEYEGTGIGLAICKRIIQNHNGLITAEDRKSTRLNSSHSQISYAVFCLKKK